MSTLEKKLVRERCWAAACYLDGPVGCGGGVHSGHVLDSLPGTIGHVLSSTLFLYLSVTFLWPF